MAQNYSYNSLENLERGYGSTECAEKRAERVSVGFPVSASL
jgi:hypothetical protein